MHHKPSRSGFTLIELLVVIAIIAVLAVVVILTLNPAQLLAQGRDSQRISDMATLQSALNLYSEDQTGLANFSLGTSSQNTTSFVALSVYDPQATSSQGSACAGLGLPFQGTSTWPYDCAASSTYRLTNGTGWIPVNLNSITAGSPISVLPVDPVSQTSSGLYYTYVTNGSQYDVSSFLESSKYAKTAFNEGGSEPTLLQSGSGIASLPDLGRGLVGYWPVDEGSGTVAIDWSGNASNGTFTGSPSWTSGHVWQSGLQVSNGNYLTLITPSGALPTSSITVAVWEDTNTSTFQSNSYYLYNNWELAAGSWALLSDSFGDLKFGISGPAAGTPNYAACNTALTLNTWQFVVGTYDGNTLKAYVNGNQCGTVSLSGQALYTGSHISDLPVTAGDAYITNDIRVYNRVLSAAEIQEIYNAEK